MCSWHRLGRYDYGSCEAINHPQNLDYSKGSFYYYAVYSEEHRHQVSDIFVRESLGASNRH